MPTKPLSRFPWIFSKKKKKESSPPPATATATTTPTLPDELVAEILSHLRPRIACKLKLVSKSWHQLISHPSLIPSLKRRRSADRALGFFSSSSGASTVCFHPLPTAAAANNRSLISSIDRQLREIQGPILSSSNGLLLTGSSTKLVVWDPVTNDSTSIPPPSWSECTYGLSATGSGSFDIVGVTRIGAVPCFHSVPITILYSSRAKHWTALFTPRDVDVCRYLNPAGPASAGRSLYWLQRGSVLALNVKRRATRSIALPRDDMVARHGNAWLGRVGENLHLVHVSDEENLEVWRLERRGRAKKRWEKVMEAKGDGWGAPEFFDGRRIAFSSPPLAKIEFYDTCCEGWRGSISYTYTYTDSADGSHCSVPYYL